MNTCDSGLTCQGGVCVGQGDGDGTGDAGTGMDDGADTGTGNGTDDSGGTGGGGPSAWVAVGDAGLIYFSGDGNAWEQVTVGITSMLRDVEFGAGRFVAVGDEGVVLTSPDGATWQPEGAGTSEAIRRIAYSQGLFVALVENGDVLTSPDGIAWSEAPRGPDMKAGCLYGAGGVFWVYSVGEEFIFSTSDAQTWENRGAPLEPAEESCAVTSQDGISLAHFSNTVWLALDAYTDNVGLGLTCSGGVCSTSDPAHTLHKTVNDGGGGWDFPVAQTLLPMNQVSLDRLEALLPNPMFSVLNSGSLRLPIASIAPGSSDSLFIRFTFGDMSMPRAISLLDTPSGTEVALLEVLRIPSELDCDDVLCVVVGEGNDTEGTLETSPDGTTWTARLSAAPAVLLGVAHS